MKNQAGFSLLEVLITIVILAVGLLGLAGLTAAAMRNNHGAHYRSQAVWLSYDILERMRANRNLAIAESYDIALAGAAPGGGAVHAVDLQQWKAAVAALPNGQGAIDYVPATRRATITIQWDESRAAGSAATAGDAARQFVVETQL